MTIVSLREVKKQSASDNVIAALERLLARAKSGDLRSLGFIEVSAGGLVGHGFETDYEAAHAHHMVAGAVYLLEMARSNAAEDRR